MAASPFTLMDTYRVKLTASCSPDELAGPVLCELFRLGGLAFNRIRLKWFPQTLPATLSVLDCPSVKTKESFSSV